MKVFYTDRFVLPLPEGHRFPMKKYAMLRETLEKTNSNLSFFEPKPASRGQLALAHCPIYIESVFSGNLTAAHQKAIGFPWSESMVERSIRSVGASIDAAFAAYEGGASVNLAGGTHHAAKAQGGGFCVFNDFVVAARVMQADCIAKGRKEPRVLIVDLDVHQGDGTAQVVRSDPTIFSLSLHGAENYPFEKAESDLDVALPSGCEDDQYLSALDKALAVGLSQFKPDMVFYLAGLDAHRDDRLGKLCLSDEGIRGRDEMVFGRANQYGLPVVMAMGGGYFRDLSKLVELQSQTVLRLFESVFKG